MATLLARPTCAACRGCSSRCHSDTPLSSRPNLGTCQDGVLLHQIVWCFCISFNFAGEEVAFSICQCCWSLIVWSPHPNTYLSARIHRASAFPFSSITTTSPGDGDSVSFVWTSYSSVAVERACRLSNFCRMCRVSAAVVGNCTLSFDSESTSWSPSMISCVVLPAQFPAHLHLFCSCALCRSL